MIRRLASLIDRVGLRVRAAVLLGLLALAVASPADAQVVRNFAPRFSTNDNGDILPIGNTIMSCSASGTCTNGRNGTGGSVDNNDFTMVYVDVDTDAATFSSSRATLTMPAGATVLWAGLYWGGNTTTASRNTVRFSTPTAGYVSLTATQLDATGGNYQGYVNVTTQVAAGGNGTYTVANVRSTPNDANMYAGWSLVVAYRNPVSGPRNLVVFDGFWQVAPGATVTIPVSGFLSPPAGTVNTRLGVVAYEGDLGLTGDQFSLNGVALSNAANPVTNFFNSSVSVAGVAVTTKTPNYVNQLGFDVDLLTLVNAVPNGATGASIRLSSTDDRYFPGVVTFATDLYAPIVSGNGFTKTVTDVNGGSARPGDVLEYTIALTNSGLDGAVQTVVRDTLPVNATYVPGSLTVVSGANAGAKTDATGDDQAEYTAAARRVTFRVGTGANATTGGSLAPAAATSVRFRVTINTPLPNGTLVSNQAAVNFNGAQLGTAFSAMSDGDLVAPGANPTVVTVASGVNVTGFAYADADHDGLRDATEAGTGLALFAKLILASSPATAQAVATVNVATGAYAFTFVVPGTYSIVLDNNATAADVTPTIPAGWLVLQAAPGVRTGIAVAAVDVAGQDFGLWNGSRFSGVVFRDDGVGGGIANDGVRQANETGTAGVRVRLLSAACAGGACDSALTAGGGLYTLWLPAAAAGAVRVTEVNPASWLSTGGTPGSTGGVYTRATDQFAITAATGTSYSGPEFGDVPPNAFAAPGVRSGAPGAVVLHPHVYTAASGGQVSFATSQTVNPALPGWTAQLFRDLDCDGVVDPGEPVAGGPVALSTGQTACLILRQAIPAGAPAGASSTVTLTASYAYANATPALSANASLADLTVVVDSGGLAITKSVDVASARPGDLLTYTIVYRNQGAAPISALVIRDATPGFTVFDSAACGSLGTGLTGCAITSAPAVGATGTLAWTMSGSLAPGASGSVTFRVRVQ